MLLLRVECLRLFSAQLRSPLHPRRDQINLDDDYDPQTSCAISSRTRFSSTAPFGFSTMRLMPKLFKAARSCGEMIPAKMKTGMVARLLDCFSQVSNSYPESAPRRSSVMRASGAG